MTSSQRSIAKCFFPVLGIAAIFLSVSAFFTFGTDKEAAKAVSKTCYYAGVSIQGYFIYIVLRDVFISLKMFYRGRRDVFFVALFTHYFAACIDNFLLGIMMIWGSCALASDEASTFAESFSIFHSFMTVNVILAYVYVLSHCCVLPVIFCVLACKPNFLRNLQGQ